MGSQLMRFVRAITSAKVRGGAQSGQAIVLMALMMVGLLAAVGLAIDGGGLFFLYRDMQNATDAAVVAATYARCANGDVVFAGMDAAARNSFDNNGVTNWVQISHPPTAGVGAGDLDYVEVMISAIKPSYFIQLVYPEELRISSRAVGRCSPPFEPMVLPGLWAGSRTCGDTINWTGAEGTIEGGVFSNNEIKSGGGGQGNTIIGDSQAVNFIQESQGGNTTWYPAPQTGVPPQEDPLRNHFFISDFAPTGRYGMQAQSEGLYKAILTTADDPDMKSNGTWDPRNGRVLDGLYYVEGNVSIGAGVNYGVHGITIVATGQISFSGGTAMHYYMDGFLLVSGYQATNCGTDAVSISGATNYWYGVIYAPGGGVKVSNSSMQVTGMIIADRIDFSGSRLDIIADPDVLPPIPAGVVIAE